jgi:DNA primase
MPYPHAVQHRVGLTDKKNRFRWQVGSEASAKELYGAEWLRAIDKTILAVEGTTDVAAALLLGVPVVGLPGTGTWSRKTGPGWAKGLEGRNVVLWQEPGEAGQKLADAMAQDIPGLRVIQPPPGIKDVVELLDQAGAGAMLRDLMEEAEPHRPAPEEEAVPVKASGLSPVI